MYNSLECLDNLKTCKEEDRRYHLQALANSLRELEGEKGDVESLESEVSELKDTVESLESTVEDMDDRYISRDWFDLSDYGGISSEEVGALEEEFRHHVHELEDKTEGLQTDLDALESTVKDKADYSEMDDRLSELEAGEIDKLLHCHGQVFALEDKVQELETKLAEMAIMNANLSEYLANCFMIVENRLSTLETSDY